VTGDLTKHPITIIGPMPSRVFACPQAFKQPFTAVLCAPGVSTNNCSSGGSCQRRCCKYTAVVSRTNRLLRAHLAAYGCEGVVAGQLEQHVAAAAAAKGQQRQGKQQQQQLVGQSGWHVGVVHLLSVH
jgi:MinD superfamily P-loop ATPase